MHFSIVRWDHWLWHPEFPAVHGAFSCLAASDPVLSAAVARDIDDFIARQARRGGIPADENRGTHNQPGLSDRRARHDHLARRRQTLGAALSPARAGLVQSPAARQSPARAAGSRSRLLRPHQFRAPQTAPASTGRPAATADRVTIPLTSNFRSSNISAVPAQGGDRDNRT
jgi:hypothetical protein